jgi:hypothetical protein
MITVSDTKPCTSGSKMHGSVSLSAILEGMGTVQDPQPPAHARHESQPECLPLDRSRCRPPERHISHMSHT